MKTTYLEFLKMCDKTDDLAAESDRLMLEPESDKRTEKLKDLHGRLVAHKKWFESID